MTCLIVGIGNENRGDDALGLIAADRLLTEALAGVEVVRHSGEPASLMELWQGYDKVILVDAVLSKGTAGTVFNFDLITTALPESFRRTSTHGFGIFEAVELGRILNQLPAELYFHGIEGKNFNMGDKLSEEVLNNIDKLIEGIKQNA